MNYIRKLILLMGMLTLSSCAELRIYEQPILSSIPASIVPYQENKQTYDDLMSNAEKNVKVTMLLPLTGDRACVGEDLRNAGMMAQFDIANDNFILRFEDTKGTPEGAAEALERAMDTGVDLVLGPVYAEEVDAIRKKARRNNVLVVSFTSDIESVDDGVYTMALSIPNQISRAVRYACEKGKKSLVILAPDDRAGDFAIDSAEATAKQCGMRISAISVYNPTFINFEPYVLKVLPDSFVDKKILVKQNKKEKNKKELPIADQIDFDVLLIADKENRLKSIASLFALYDVTPREVLFLGMSTWQDASLTLEGALTGAKFASLPTFGAEDFKSRYEALHKRKPIGLASLSYDAVALTSVLSQHGGINKETLTTPSGFLGIDGPFRLLANGESERLLGISEIVGRNQFRVVQKPSANFKQEKLRKENLENIRLKNEIEKGTSKTPLFISSDEVNADIENNNQQTAKETSEVVTEADMFDF